MTARVLNQLIDAIFAYPVALLLVNGGPRMPKYDARSATPRTTSPGRGLPQLHGKALICRFCALVSSKPLAPYELHLPLHTNPTNIHEAEMAGMETSISQFLAPAAKYGPFVAVLCPYSGAPVRTVDRCAGRTARWRSPVAECRSLSKPGNF